MEVGPDGRIKAPDLPDNEVEKIRKEFLGSLVLPKERCIPQFILCPVGRIGAGKSTVITALIEHFPLVRIANDDVRKLLHDYGYNYRRTREITWPVFERFAREGYSIALDSNCASDSAREMWPEFHKLANEVGAKILWIHVNPPDEFIINKLRNYHHTWLFKDGEHAVSRYLARKPERSVDDVPFIYTFDPSR